MREFLFSLLVIPLFVPLMTIFIFWNRLNKRLRPALVFMSIMLAVIIFSMVLIYTAV
jgi:hypothetical protein